MICTVFRQRKPNVSIVHRTIPPEHVLKPVAIRDWNDATVVPKVEEGVGTVSRLSFGHTNVFDRCKSRNADSEVLYLASTC